MNERIFVAVPTPEHVHKRALPGLCAPSLSRTRAWCIRVEGHSMLNKSFNDLLCMAMNERSDYGWRYFVMHHSDIEAEIGWLDKLMDEYHRVGADVLSAVMPIKDPRGVTSTGWRNKAGVVTRVTMDELWGKEPLPMTFCIDDLSDQEGDHLLINTGLMVFDMEASWVEPWLLAEGFCSTDKVFKDPVTGMFSASSFTEDWSFSEYCHAHDLKCMATKAVKCTHHGAAGYDNFRSWGEWKKDEGQK